MTSPLGRLGYGTMQLSWKPEPVPDDKAFPVIKRAIDAGIKLVNTADFYGPPKDPLYAIKQLGRFYQAYPEYTDKTILSVKTGFNQANFKPDLSENFLREQLKQTVAALGDKKIDILIPARRDFDTPLEQSMTTFKNLRDEGVCNQIGISELGADSIRKAASIVPIAMIEVEYSLLVLDIEKNGVQAACRDNGITIVAYSPLARGLLTGSFDKNSIQKGDFRLTVERFQDGAIEKNLKVVEQFTALANKKGITTSQLALAWLMAQGAVPIFGTSRLSTTEENVKALEVKLSDEEVASIRKLAVDVESQIEGDRGNEHMKKLEFA